MRRNIRPAAPKKFSRPKLSAEQTARIQDLALRVHRALKLDVYSRVDFRMDKRRRVLVPRGQHAAGLDGREPVAARGRGRRHQLSRALRAHLPRRARAARQQVQVEERPALVWCGRADAATLGTEGSVVAHLCSLLLLAVGVRRGLRHGGRTGIRSRSTLPASSRCPARGSSCAWPCECAFKTRTMRLSSTRAPRSTST